MNRRLASDLLENYQYKLYGYEDHEDFIDAVAETWNGTLDDFDRAVDEADLTKPVK